MTNHTAKEAPDADLLAIRALLEEDGGETSQPAQAARRSTSPRVNADRAVPELHTRVGDPADDGQASSIRSRLALRGAQLWGHIRQRVSGYRPTRRHVALAVLVMIAVLRPWVLAGLILLPIMLTVGLFAALGQERFWAGVLRGYKRFHQRQPARAERFRTRMDAIALRWDAVLDRFPEGVADALSLPDLNSLQEIEARHEKALDRRFDRLQDEAGAQ